jgi:hypothetical protein
MGTSVSLWLQAVAKRSYLRPKFASVAVGSVGASNAAVEQRLVECSGTGTKAGAYTRSLSAQLVLYLCST